MSAVEAPRTAVLTSDYEVTPAPAPPDTGRVPASRPGGRLAWLDALRGFAALCVVFDHAGYRVLRGIRADVYQWFDPGQYGVFVFFLVSGYIVPASLERKGSLRGFWISRAFRLYPLYLLALAATVIGAAYGLGSLNGAQRHPLTSAAGWLLMMPDVLGQALNVPDVTWTLSFEMVFYLVVACLFSWRLHRRSGTIALGLAAGAVVFGGLLPISGLYYLADAHGQAGLRTLYLTADALILGGVVVSAVASRGGGTVRRAGKIGATVAAVTALVLLFFNESYPFSFSPFQILALMFTGTLIYRAERGEIPRGRAAAIALAVLALTLAAGLWHGQDLGAQWQWQWVTSLGGAALTFAVGQAARHRGLPGWMAWLGLVSYSVYLLHPLVIACYSSLARDIQVGTGVQVFIAAGMYAVILVAGAITYYALERPMQKLGRRLSAKAGI